MNEFYEGIDKIADNLWLPNGYSAVALMVGAGFSCNAETLSGTSLPDWNELSRAMLRELHPKSCKEDLEAILLKKGAPRIAGIYEACYGSEALSSLIEAQLTFSNPKPSRLHRDIMLFPWSDVFTTNYDNLLEEADSRGEYSVVTNSSLIASVMRPRIIKLHGSIPDAKPYIITEQHYRQYPQDNAVMVNTVKQGLLENSLLLVGFSGEDPNFRNWIGWVQDNLGKKSRQVFLFGALGLSKNDLSYFKANHIQPLDFLSIYPELTSSKHKHRIALEWLLQKLSFAAPSDSYTWPREGQKQVQLADPSEDVRPFLRLGENVVDSSSKRIPYPKLPILGNSLEIWRKARLRYPGWLVCPLSNRQSMMSLNTWTVLPAVVKEAQKSEIHIGLEILSELWARFKIAHLPLYEWVVIQTLSFLEKNVAQLDILIDAEPNSCDIDNYLDVWQELVIHLIEWGAIHTDKDVFYRSNQLLAISKPTDVNIISRQAHAKCLYSIGQLNFEELLDNLSDWDILNSSPLHKAQKARLLEDVNQSPEAFELTEQAMNDVSKTISRSSMDFYGRTTRSWLQLLWNRVCSSDHSRRDPRDSKLNYSPYEELSRLRDLLNAPIPRQNQEVEYKKDSFGEYPTSWKTLGTSYPYDELFPALSSAYLICLIPIPRKVVTETFINTANWIGLRYPRLAVTILLLSGSKDGFDDWLDFVSVSAFEKPLLDEMFESAVKASYHFIEGCRRTGSKCFEFDPKLQERIFQCSIQIIGRLMFRMETLQVVKALDIACILHSEEPFCNNRNLYPVVKELFSRSKYALSVENILPMISRLFNLRLFSPRVLNGEKESKYCNPVMMIPECVLQDLRVDDLPESFVETIDHLISEVTSPQLPESRVNAMMRLVKLEDNGLLSEVDYKRTAEAIWSRKCKKCGLAEHIGYCTGSVAYWPTPEHETPVFTMRVYLLTRGWKSWLPSASDSRGELNDVLMAGYSYIEEAFRLSPFRGSSKSDMCDWSSFQTYLLLSHIHDWYINAQKVSDKYSEPMLGLTLGAVLERLKMLLAEIVPPVLKKLEPDEREEIGSLLSKMLERDSSSLQLQLLSTELLDKDVASLEFSLAKAIRSPDPKILEDGLVTLVIWKRQSINEYLPQPSNELLVGLVNRVESGISSAKSICINYLIVAVRHCFVGMNEIVLNSIDRACTSLLYQTSNPSIDDLINYGYTNESIQRKDLAFCRKLSSRLTLLLKEQCLSQGMDSPSSAELWREQVTDEDIAPVRRDWK